MDLPGASAAVADISDHLRVAQDRQDAWPQTRYTVVQPGPVPHFDLDTSALRWHPGHGELPAEAVFLGRVDGTDFWAVPGVLPAGQRLRNCHSLLNAVDAGLATTAQSLLNWHQTNRFCTVCAAATYPVDLGWRRRCANDHLSFPRTDPAVIVLVTDGADRVLLARHHSWPPGRLSVLAGFAEAGESLEQAVYREIGEEVGLPVAGVRYLGSQPWPYPQSLMVAFTARAQPSLPLRCAVGEIADARWVHRRQVQAALGGDTSEFTLPPAISIAHQMLRTWAS